MKILKIIGIVVLVLFVISGAIQLLLSGLVMVAAFVQNAGGNMSYLIGRFTGAMLIEILVVFGLVKLIRSLRKSRNDQTSEPPLSPRDDKRKTVPPGK